MPPLVYVIDDELAIRRALLRTLKSVGLNAEAFASAEEFLDAPRRETDACLILDVRLPGRSGMDLQRELVASGSSLPIVFVTAHTTSGRRREAMAAGAVAFLSKPVDEQALFEAIKEGLARATGAEPTDNQGRSSGRTR